MALLAENYYASSFQGEMGLGGDGPGAAGLGSTTRPGGLLEREAGDIHLSQDTVLALACTLYFQGKWTDEFQPGDTSPQTFHSPAGDVTVDFMHEWKRTGTYYWGDRFGAVSRGLGESGASMWFLLPRRGGHSGGAPQRSPGPGAAALPGALQHLGPAEGPAHQPGGAQVRRGLPDGPGGGDAGPGRHGCVPARAGGFLPRHRRLGKARPCTCPRPSITCGSPSTRRASPPRPTQ